MQDHHQFPEPQPSKALVRRRSEDKALRKPVVDAQPSSYAYETDDATDSAGLLEYWRVLRRHWRPWLVWASAGLLIGILVTLPQTRVYRAHTSLEVLGVNQDFLNMRQASPITDSDRSYETSDLQTQIKLIQSDSLLDRVMTKLEATRRFSAPPPSLMSRLRKALHLNRPNVTGQYNPALVGAADSLRARAAGQTRIIDVTIDSPNPTLAADFANTLGTEFIEQNLESRWKTTQKTSEWLGSEINDMRLKLENSEAALQRYARASGLIFTDEKTSVSEEKLRELQQELSKAISDRIAKQSRYELAQHAPPEDLSDVIKDDALADARQRLTDLRRQVADLRAVYRPEYSKVKRTEAELEAVQANFDRDRAAIINSIKNDYEGALRKENLLAGVYDAQTKRVTGEGQKSIEYNILKREVDSNRQLYDTMLQQLKESSIASAMRASNVRIVDAARVPRFPYKPNIPLTAAGGLLGGIFFGAAFILMRERADRTIQQPGDIPLYINLPELGIIPLMDNYRKAARTLKNTARRDGPGEDDRVELVTCQRKPSMIAESFRSTLMSILFTSDNRSHSKTFVITSVHPGEGKSTVTSNLAGAIAEVGLRVLIIDADLRRPRQHEIFSIENKVGLSTILREKMSLNGDNSLGGTIRESEVPGLFLLTSGPSASGVANVLYSSKVSELLTHLRNQFDVILIDTPPMLEIADARVLGRVADKVVLVVRAGHTTRDAVIAASQRFIEDGTSVLGAILNNWDRRTAHNGYYGYYKRYGYYKKHGYYEQHSEKEVS